MSRLNELLEAYRDGEKQYIEISASVSCREFCTDEVYCMGSGPDMSSL